MANQEHLDILKQGVDVWNKWRAENPIIEPDLSQADLRRVYLKRADLYQANLSGANLHRADLTRADLTLADLFEANLRQAILNEADMSFANLDRTNLRQVSLYFTIFAHVDLSKVRGLTEIEHVGPSHLTLNTLQLPQDGSALHFLRGAGIADEWIDFYRAQIMHPIQYHSLFISYSSKDETLARRLHADLQDHGVRCWFAPEDMKVGDKIRNRIDQAIHLQDKLLLLLSQHAIASSWVEKEVETAFEKERQQNRQVLFPVRLDDVVMQTSTSWAADIRRMRHMTDFTNWKDHDTYQKAFTRLLRDLKAET